MTGQQLIDLIIKHSLQNHRIYLHSDIVHTEATEVSIIPDYNAILLDSIPDESSGEPIIPTALADIPIFSQT